MASAVYIVSGYQRQSVQQYVAVKQAERSNNSDVTFAPTLLDLQPPTRSLLNVLQWKRGISDFLSDRIGGFVSGAVSLR